MRPLGDVPCIDACVLSLDPDGSLRCLRLENLYTEERCQRVGQSGTGDDLANGTHVVIIAMRAVLVALLINGHVLAECLLALLTNKSHLGCPRKRVRLCFRVTFGAVEPLLAARGTDGDLSV